MSPNQRLRPVLVLLLPLLLAACSPPAGDEATADAAAEPWGYDHLPGFAELADGWQALEPGGETACSDGSDWRFFVRPASSERLLVYFQGGGACWFGDNCSLERSPSYRHEVGDTDPSQGSGIFDLAQAENPFADYSMVYVPYCTGDVHLGNRVVTYEVPASEEAEASEVTIRHQGWVNAMVAIEWTERNFSSPETVFVTGSSAGAIPSPYYAAHLADRYPDARVVQLGDGAGGYRRDASASRPHDQWGTLEVIDDLPEFASLTDEEFDYEALYSVAARRHPNAVFAAYDNAEDVTQKRFLALGGASVGSLRELIDANRNDIRQAAPGNFRSFVAPGELHTVLGRPELYLFTVDDVRLIDWLAALAAGEPVEDVHCLDDCDAPPPQPTASTGGG